MLQYRGIVAFILVFMTFSVWPAFAGPFEDMWQKAIPVMEKGLDAMAAKGKEEKGVFDYVTGRKSEYNRIVERTFEILSVSEVQQKMSEVRDLRHRIVSARADIAKYRKASIGAPTESMNPLTDTKDSLKRKIASTEESIKGYEQGIEDVKRQIAEEIAKSNIKISAEQIDSLFLSIDGDDQITILGMAENIKMMQAQIEESLKAGNTGIEVVKTYAGVFMMVNEAYAFAYTATMEKIENQYLKKLGEIINESNKLKTEAESLYAGADNAQKNNLRANIASNDLTVTVGSKYKTYLVNQLQHLKNTKAKIDNNVKIATNTYNTIRNSSQLLSLMNSSAADIKALLSFKMPEFAVLHDETLRKEFSAITARLQAE